MPSNLFRLSIAKKIKDPVARYSSAEKKRLHQAQRRRCYIFGQNLFAIGKMNITRSQLVSGRQQISDLIEEGVLLLQDLGAPGVPVVSVESVLGPDPHAEPKSEILAISGEGIEEVLPVTEVVEEPPASAELPEPGRDVLELTDTIATEDEVEVGDADEVAEAEPAAEEDVRELLLAAGLKRKNLRRIADCFFPALSKPSKSSDALDVILEALDSNAPYKREEVLKILKEG